MKPTAILGTLGILMAAVAFVTGCADSDGGHSEMRALRGSAVLEEPLWGADVDILVPVTGVSSRTDFRHGNDYSMAVHMTPVKTGDMGTFLFLDSVIPENFRVLVQNGRHGDYDFNGRLIADIRDFDREEEIVHVNLVTTLTGVYLDRHPDVTLEEATTVIRNFLKIPHTVDIDESTLPSQYFDPGLFMAEADSNGSLDRFIEMLVAEIENDPDAVHSFQPAQIFTGDTSGIVAKIGDKLFEGALSWLGGKGFGWALSKIGVNFDDLDPAVIREILNTLNEIKTMISDLSQRMEEMYRLLSAQITQTDYNIRIGQIDPMMNIIKSTASSLSYLASIEETSKNRDWIATEKERIRFIIGTQLLPQALVINDQLTGKAGAEGLIKVWSRIVKNKHRFLSSADSEQMKGQVEYFDVIQLTLFELIIEYYHATDAPTGVITNAIDEYKANREVQLGLVPPPIPEKALIETETGLMVYPCDVWDGYSYLMGITPCYDTNYRDHAVTVDIWHAIFGQRYNGRPTYPGEIRKPLLGFNNWHMPARAEILRMFNGWTGSGAGSWAVSQGYLEDYINDHMKLYTYEYQQNHWVSYVLLTTNGKLIDNPISRYCIACCGTEKNGYAIPVRSLASKEYYFW